LKKHYWFGLYFALGLWLGLSPFILGFGEEVTPAWGAIGSGIVCFVTALIGFMSFDRKEVEIQHFAKAA